MKTLQIRRIQTQAEKYFPYIDISDIQKDKPEDIENKRLSRSLSALGLDILTNYGLEECGKHVTDEYGDNGIDGLLFDRKNKSLVIIQSKWIKSGCGSPDLGSTLKFIKGVKDMIKNATTSLGKKAKQFAEEVTSALDDPDVKIVVSLIFTGDSIAPEVESSINEFLESENYEDTISFIPIYGKHLLDKSSDLAKATNITIELLVEQWGMIQNNQTIQAIYGQIACSDIAALYESYGERLTDENIRKFLGETSINKKIQSSLVQKPGDFIYLNNGITITCKNLKKKPLGGNNRDSGVFIAEGAQIVNGAQTFSCIAGVAKNQAQILQSSKLLVRVISINGMTDDFNKSITQATNNQNKIDKKDFASIDGIQVKLRAELALLGIQYIIKSGESRNDSFSNQTSIEEAISSLACSSENLSYAILAKKEIGKLWEDLDSPPYTEIFKKETTASRVWKAIQVNREIHLQIKTHTDKKIATYADKVIAFAVISLLERDDLLNPDKPLPDTIKSLTDSVIKNLSDAQHQNFQDAMLSRLFYNQEKTVILLNKTFEKMGHSFRVTYQVKQKKTKQIG